MKVRLKWDVIMIVGIVAQAIVNLDVISDAITVAMEHVKEHVKEHVRVGVLLEVKGECNYDTLYQRAR
ncbi:MAG: hypothetical protein IJ549_02125 [Prevotella sp.]|nr:hypothetical protein [Prevotella sp.]